MLVVTGGIGFIGSWYCDQVLGRYSWERILCVDCLASCTSPRTAEYLTLKYGEERFELVAGDICSAETIGFLKNRLRNTRYALVHFAAETLVDFSFTNPKIVAQTNIIGTQNVLELVRDTSSPENMPLFLHMSTDEVYGEQLDCHEDTTILQPTTPYAAAKAAAEMLVQAYAKTWKLDCVIIRCSNVYGPRQFPEKIVPIACANLVSGRPTVLHGSGMNKRRYLYVTDAVNAIELIRQKGETGKVYNVGTGLEGELTNLELVNLLAGLAGFRDPSSLVEFGQDRLYNDAQYSMNCERIRALKWVPQMNLKDGMSECLKWARENPHWFAMGSHHIDTN